MRLRAAILISGGGSNMVELARSMTGDHPARVSVVISNRPGAGGLARAADLGIDTGVVDHKAFETRAAFEAALQEMLARFDPDFICLAGFMRILSADFVRRWRGRMLNIHPSLLPKYRGLNTHARALEAGDSHHGCTVHAVTEELDDGEILGQSTLEVREGDTPGSLAARVLRLEHELYPRVARAFAETLLT